MGKDISCHLAVPAAVASIFKRLANVFLIRVGDLKITELRGWLCLVDRFSDNNVMNLLA